MVERVWNLGTRSSEEKAFVALLIEDLERRRADGDEGGSADEGSEEGEADGCAVSRVGGIVRSTTGNTS